MEAACLDYCCRAVGLATHGACLEAFAWCARYAESKYLCLNFHVSHIHFRCLGHWLFVWSVYQQACKENLSECSPNRTSCSNQANASGKRILDKWDGADFRGTLVRALNSTLRGRVWFLGGGILEPGSFGRVYQTRTRDSGGSMGAKYSRGFVILSLLSVAAVFLALPRPLNPLIFVLGAVAAIALARLGLAAAAPLGWPVPLLDGGSRMGLGQRRLLGLGDRGRDCGTFLRRYGRPKPGTPSDRRLLRPGTTRRQS